MSCRWLLTVALILSSSREEVFSKKIDKLQTNHRSGYGYAHLLPDALTLAYRGVFVLSDFKFKWLERYAADDIVTKKAAAR